MTGLTAAEPDSVSAAVVVVAQFLPICNIALCNNYYDFPALYHPAYG